MKTSLKQIIDWAKKNWKYIILVLLVILSVIWISVREGRIKAQAKKIAELEYFNFVIDKERQTLKLQLEKLQSEYSELEKKSDSLKLALLAKKQELRDLIKRHQSEIDSLTSIPADSAYKRLQEIYPNYDSGELKFPFSSSQVSPIYKTAVGYPMLMDEFSLQGKTLNTCYELNNAFEKNIDNLNGQIGNLTEQIGKCDQQITNYKSEIVLIQKDNKKQKFWKKVFLTIAGITTGIAILK